MKTLFTQARKRDIFLAVILTVFIISFAVVIAVFFKQLYYFDIDYLHIPETTGLSRDIIKESYDTLIQYQSIFYRGDLNLPHFAISTTGRIHFEEVKRIFDMIQIICLTTGIISGIMVFINMKEKEYRYLPLTSRMTVIIPATLGFLVALDFDKAFVIFHKIFFRNDYWIFDSSTDPVIKILPDTFFMHSFILIIVLILIMSFLLNLFYKKKAKYIIEGGQNMNIRQANEADYSAIYQLVEVAFQTALVSDGKEQDFVLELRKRKTYIPELELVMEDQGQIIGHIMLTKQVIHGKNQDASGLLLAPLCVKEEYRQQQVGSQLVYEAMRLALQMGYTSLFLVGHPEYYQRFGFQTTVSYGIENRSEIPDEYVMACELVKGILSGIGGYVTLE